MKRIILLALVIATLTIPKTYAIYPDPIPVPRTQLAVSPEKERVDIPADIPSYIREKAQETGISPEIALFVAAHESQFIPSKVGDDDKVCDAPKSPNFGLKQHSRGLWQISDCWHYEVPDKCAYSVSCSTEWTMSYVRAHGWGEWSTYKEYGK